MASQTGWNGIPNSQKANDLLFSFSLLHSYPLTNYHASIASYIRSSGNFDVHWHLEVQWSPIFPQVLHTMRTAPDFASNGSEELESSALVPIM
ncbi:hypothetical protein Tco_1455344 [Tanacetum coccineum]